jgi:hypothetical protein
MSTARIALDDLDQLTHIRDEADLLVTLLGTSDFECAPGLVQIILRWQVALNKILTAREAALAAEESQS